MTAPFVRGLITVLGACATLHAVAAGTTYTFTTGNAAYGTGPVGVFDFASTVSGSFSWDNAVAAGGSTSNGATLYNLSFNGLSGSVQGFSFSDPGGYTAVGDALPSMGANDYLQLGADPGLGTGTHNIAGFGVAGYTLVNVRIFWIQGQLGIGDFLSGNLMPPTLPAFPGRLALDFVANSAPTGPLSFVFFDGAVVHAVPEPPVAALGLAGALLLALRRGLSRPRAAPGRR